MIVLGWAGQGPGLACLPPNREQLLFLHYMGYQDSCTISVLVLVGMLCCGSRARHPHEESHEVKKLQVKDVDRAANAIMYMGPVFHSLTCDFFTLVRGGVSRARHKEKYPRMKDPKNVTGSMLVPVVIL